MRNSKLILPLLMLTWWVSCKQPYDIPVSSSDQSFLVVEGNFNSGQQTSIRLTRTFRLNDTAKLRAETGALLTVEGNDNSINRLNETSNGIYGQAFSLVAGRQYRLRIKTSAGKEYLSDYIIAKNNPPIDSINWKQDNKGVTIFANTHDPANSSVYYRWECDETWEIHSYFYSTLKVVNRQIVPRTPAEDISVCWKNDFSSTINLGSSVRLQSDVIHESPVLFIPAGTEKLAVRYSILVRQYTLSKEAYEYFQIMKKNTESLGTLFDPQPSELKGNIHCISNPGEQVIGYLTACPQQVSRIFIDNNQLRSWRFEMDCISVKIGTSQYAIDFYIPPYLPYSYDPSENKYLISTPECVDCTYRGGSTSKPSFW